MEQTLHYLTAVLVLGIVAQLMAWRLGIPSILFLLAFGFAAGELWVRPGEILSESLLFPVVSLSVAVILFEGGLSLRLKELREAGTPVLRLCTWGVVVAWLTATLAGHLVLGFDWSVASLLGAILVVTGPTVIAPLLRVIQPSRTVSSIIKWEGIVIDPIGATFALLVFEIVSAVNFSNAATDVVLTLGKTLLVGTVFGLLSGWLVTRLLDRYAIPDYLHNVFMLVCVAVLFAVSDALQHESGLLTVTIFGIVLANQDRVPVNHIIAFKENLRVLLISTLFIVLSGRVSWAQLTAMGWRPLIFTAILIVLARPLSVFLSTIGTRLSRNERWFLSSLAPRGIVAAAVTSVFALKLTAMAEERGNAALAAQANQLVPVVFTVIVGTVAFYGIVARPIARRLGLARRTSAGILFAGAAPWVRALAKSLHDEGVAVTLVDTNQENVKEARLAGLSAKRGNIASEEVIHDLELTGIGRLLAATPNDESNGMSVYEFSHRFGRRHVYQLSPAENPDRLERDKAGGHFMARHPFEGSPSYKHLNELFACGFRFKKTRISPEFNMASFRELYGEEAITLFRLNREKEILDFHVDGVPTTYLPGDVLIALVPPATDEAVE